MMQSVIDYRPSHGGGLDYHNSPLIGEIPATELYHMHRSIDQLRSLNERGTLNHLASAMNNSELKSTSSSAQSASAAAALQLEYKLYANNNNNAHEHNHQTHHDNMDYLKSEVSALIDDQSDKIDSVLKQVEKHEIESAYNASSLSPTSTPPPAPLTDGRGRKKGSKKVFSSPISIISHFEDSFQRISVWMCACACFCVFVCVLAINLCLA